MCSGPWEGKGQMPCPPVNLIGQCSEQDSNLQQRDSHSRRLCRLGYQSISQPLRRSMFDVECSMFLHVNLQHRTSNIELDSSRNSMDLGGIRTLISWVQTKRPASWTTGPFDSLALAQGRLSAGSVARRIRTFILGLRRAALVLSSCRNFFARCLSRVAGC